jgi:hypothetical protein
MATVYPDVKIVEEVYNILNVVWNISIFIVLVASQTRNSRHTGSDTKPKTYKLVNIRT